MKFSDIAHRHSSKVSNSIPGFEHGVVVDVEDPKKMGRIKVRLSWMDKSASSDWIFRFGGGGNAYGETESIPQKGELVQVLFWKGSMHHMVYFPASWTPGGKGELGDVPPSLPPQDVETRTVHDPGSKKFKVWVRKTIGGFLTWVGEAITWMKWQSPGGFQFILEHDHPVGDLTQATPKTPLPYHHLKFQSPLEIFTEIEEWPVNDIHRVRLSHPIGHFLEFRDKPVSLIRETEWVNDFGGKVYSYHNLNTGEKRMDHQHPAGFRIRMKEMPGVKFLEITDPDGGSFKLDVIAKLRTLTDPAGNTVTLNENTQSITLTSPLKVTVNAPEVNLGGEGGSPVARIGDSVVNGVIVSGSSVVKGV